MRILNCFSMSFFICSNKDKQMLDFKWIDKNVCIDKSVCIYYIYN